MEIVATYLGHMIKHKLLTHEEHTESNYLKPMKTLNFKTSELYYYFNTTNTSSFVDLNETFLANMKLYHSDLLNDLEYTSDLYHINEDGSFTISN